MISYIIPTRDRHLRLKSTLLRLEALGDHSSCGGAEVIVIDNASRERAILPRELRSGVVVKSLHLPVNIGAAARNEGARAANVRSGWLVMLDDDSFPLDLAFVESLESQSRDVSAVSADVFLSGTPVRRESGGLPEVFIGCGVAIRREVFLGLGGYDPSFGYYAEEYDLAARMLLAGYRVVFEPAFRVMHCKDGVNRDMNVILERLVRNNGWVAQRYAPPERRLAEIRETRTRYRRIAEAEGALGGYGRGLTELRRTIRGQARMPMPVNLHDRFTGLAAARTALGAEMEARPFRSAKLVDEGKNAWAAGQALREMGVEIIRDGRDAEAAVVATMSPGPMLDAFRARTLARRGRGMRVVMPWMIGARVGMRERLAA